MRDRNHSKPRNRKPYWEMNAKELAQATQAFDREDLSAGKPLKGRMLSRYRRAKAKRGRPRVGEGSTRISVTVEKGLLQKADRLARRLKTSRASLVARGLKAVLAETN